MKPINLAPSLSSFHLLDERTRLRRSLPSALTVRETSWILTKTLQKLNGDARLIVMHLLVGQQTAHTHVMIPIQIAGTLALRET